MTIRPLHQQYLVKKAGGGNPDPAVYCPTNGYILDPDIYIPPVILPESIVESIIFICNASVGNWRFNTYQYTLGKTGSDSYLYEVFNSLGTLVDSFNSAATRVDFDFPTNDAYYTVRISLPVATTYFANFNGGSTPSLHEDCVEYIIVNTTLLYWFSMLGNTKLNGIEFKSGSMAAINDFSYLFRGCKSMKSWKPAFGSFTGLSNMVYMFAESGLEKIDLTDLASDLDLCDYLFAACKYLSEVVMPAVWTGNRNNSMFLNTVRLRKLVLPTEWVPNGTPNTSMASFLAGSGVEGELEFPSMPYITGMASFITNCPNIEVLRLKGDWSGLTALGSIAIGSPSLHTLETPRILNNTIGTSSPVNATNTGLRYYIGPDIGFVTFPINAGLVSITGEHDTSGLAAQPAINTSTTFRTTLTVFQAIKLRCSRFNIGTSAATKFTVLTTLELDWANSNWSSTTAPQLAIAAALPAAELNRIMTALPVVVGKTLDIRYCDGYATCDKTIATAKGWTVL